MCVQEFPKLGTIGLSLLNGLLTYDPDKRLTARQALRHPYFSEAPLAKLPQDMPYFPSAHDANANDDQHKKYDFATLLCVWACEVLLPDYASVFKDHLGSSTTVC